MMNVSLIDFVIGNTLFALPLAILAWCIGRTQRHPSVSHALWAFVLVRLLLPPIDYVSSFSISIPSGTLHWKIASWEENRMTARMSYDIPKENFQPASIDQAASINTLAPASADSDRSTANDSENVEKNPSVTTTWQGKLADIAMRHGTIGFVAVWFMGSISLMIFSIVRVLRFRRLLLHAAVPAHEPIRRMVMDVAAALGRPVNSEILVTSARTPPFVWWLGAKPQVVLPKGILEGLPRGEQRLVIAHELAHIQRRDHLVRWLEWFALSWLWWNPLAWIARNGLRNSEEHACDALVLRALNPEPREYGSCLLSIAEALSETSHATPSVACTMTAAQSLEQRIVLIMSSKWTNPPSMLLRAFAATIAGIVLLMGVTGAQDRNPHPSASPNQSPQSGQNPTDEKVADNVAEPTPIKSEPRRWVIEKAIDRVTSLHVEVINSSINVIRDDSLESVRITAELKPSSDEISDAQFAGQAKAVELNTNCNEAGELVISFDDPADLNPRVFAANLWGQTNRLEHRLTIRVPELKKAVIASVNGKLCVDGDVGELLLETVNGDIEARGVLSPAVIESVNGSVHFFLADTASEKLKIAGVNGDILLSLSEQWQGSLAAQTGFGDISIGRLPGVLKRNGLGKKYSYTAGLSDAAHVQLEALFGSVRIQLD